MSETFFISDNHFGHKNILEYEPIFRPFSSVEEMNEAMVDNWNRMVTKHDKVFHVGDFAFGRQNVDIAGRLNGQKRLILGNHDAYPIEAYTKYFLSVHGALFWKDCILTHVPVHPDQLLHRSKYNIHGHLHSKYVRLAAGEEVYEEDGETISYIEWRDQRYKNVSVEQIGLTPISADILFPVRHTVIDYITSNSAAENALIELGRDKYGDGLKKYE